MPEDLLNRANFGLLPEDQGRWGSFGASMITNGVIVVLVLLFTAAKAHQIQKLKYNPPLVLAQEPPPPPKVVVPKVKVFAPPQPELAKLEPPKIFMPKPVVVPPPPKPVHLEVKQDVPKIPAPAPLKVAPPPQPKVGLFASNKPTEVANNRVEPTIKAGGFGNPLGAKPNPNSSNSQLVAMGSFNAAPGASSGAGAARKGNISGTSFGSGVAHGVAGGHDHGTIASAGFSNGSLGGTGKRPSGKVEQAGFATPIGGPPTGVTVSKTIPAFVPPVVISEPHPTYTAEAAQLRIQGEVTLEVRFLATGQVQVLRVVNGLGHGLNEEATHVAQQIRFKPAEKDGHPVDHTTLIHVTFQLA